MHQPGNSICKRRNPFLFSSQHLIAVDDAINLPPYKGFINEPDVLEKIKDLASLDAVAAKV